MKKQLCFAIFLAFTTYAIGQISFGVSPGIGFNGANAGYKINNRLTAFVGFQFLSAGYESKWSGKRYNYETQKIEGYSDSYEMSVSIYVPNLGLKYYLGNTESSLKPYLTASLAKPIVKTNFKENGVEDKVYKERTNSLSLFGGEFGFGAEYYFDEKFSIGGECGLRHFNLSYNYDYDNELYNPNTGQSEPYKTNRSYKYNLSPTYTRISLNYHF
jgi:outer membrane protein W